MVKLWDCEKPQISLYLMVFCPPTMRIAMIGQKGLPAHSGGVERHVDELVTRLASAEHEVIAYCRKHYNLNKNLVREYAGAKLIYVPTLKNKYLDTGIYTFLASLDVLF